MVAASVLLARAKPVFAAAQQAIYMS